MWWATWWVWGIAALGLAFAEVLLPSYLFLGFAVGAGLIGAGLYFSPAFAEWGVVSPELLLLVFAVLSLIAWIALRRALGLRDGQVKIIDRDINEG
ncbi:MAG: hypothetical protein AAFU56_07435 [Pseudomonadota bacterium]